MGRILRVALMVLLAAVLGVGSAWGEKKEFTDGNGVTWEYKEIEAGATCSIKPADRSSISGRVEIPGTVKVNGASVKVVSIGAEAFRGCTELTEVKFPSGLTTIGKNAFNGCSGLTAVTIPGSVTEIGVWAFFGCSVLKSIGVESGNKNYCAESGVLFTKDKESLICYPGGKPEESYTIPSSVTAIGEGAFSGCSGLKGVTIPSSVQTIAGWAFSHCSGLKEVTIPGSVAWIGDGAFSRCSGLTAVTIPSSVTRISKWAFEYCSGLTAVTIPGSVTEIGWRAFEYCSGLTAVTIPGSVTKIGERVFKDCRGLTAVTIPGSVTEIEHSAFSGCSKLNEVYWLAGSGENVDNSAFAGIATPATLYVRGSEKEKIEKKSWWKGKFTIKAGCVVTFQDGKGSKLGEQMVKAGERVGEPDEPTKEGYTFVEWQFGGKKYDFGTPVTQDITLVAVWKEAVKYKVTFDAQGGTPTPDVQMVEEGKAASEPAAPTKEGYTFVEWQRDGVKYDFNTKVTQDITLVAVWKKKEGSETAVASVQLAGVRAVRNPVGEALELEGMERAARVEVYSVAGARVHAEALRGEPRVVIDARGWAHGVYVVKVEASDGARTLRVVK